MIAINGWHWHYEDFLKIWYWSERGSDYAISYGVDGEDPSKTQVEVTENGEFIAGFSLPCLPTNHEAVLTHLRPLLEAKSHPEFREVAAKLAM